MINYYVDDDEIVEIFQVKEKGISPEYCKIFFKQDARIVNRSDCFETRELAEIRLKDKMQEQVNFQIGELEEEIRRLRDRQIDLLYKQE